MHPELYFTGKKMHALGEGGMSAHCLSMLPGEVNSAIYKDNILSLCGPVSHSFCSKSEISHIHHVKLQS